MKKIIKKESGITLIALVVTIIVLLLLAGVSIQMLTGENGILKQATRAKEETIEGQKQETLALKYAESLMMPEWTSETSIGFANGEYNAENKAAGIGQTEANPWIIENGEQLAYFASLVNVGNKFQGEYVEITKCINLGNKKFTPIGMDAKNVIGSDATSNWIYEKTFTGTLDGKGNVITGIKIEEKDKQRNRINLRIR